MKDKILKSIFVLLLLACGYVFILFLPAYIQLISRQEIIFSIFLIAVLIGILYAAMLAFRKTKHLLWVAPLLIVFTVFSYSTLDDADGNCRVLNNSVVRSVTEFHVQNIDPIPTLDRRVSGDYLRSCTMNRP